MITNSLKNIITLNYYSIIVIIYYTLLYTKLWLQCYLYAYISYLLGLILLRIIKYDQRLWYLAFELSYILTACLSSALCKLIKKKCLRSISCPCSRAPFICATYFRRPPLFGCCSSVANMPVSACQYNQVHLKPNHAWCVHANVSIDQGRSVVL